MLMPMFHCNLIYFTCQRRRFYGVHILHPKLRPSVPSELNNSQVDVKKSYTIKQYHMFHFSQTDIHYLFASLEGSNDISTSSKNKISINS